VVLQLFRKHKFLYQLLLLLQPQLQPIQPQKWDLILIQWCGKFHLCIMLSQVLSPFQCPLQQHPLQDPLSLCKGNLEVLQLFFWEVEARQSFRVTWPLTARLFIFFLISSIFAASVELDTLTAICSTVFVFLLLLPCLFLC